MNNYNYGNFYQNGRSGGPQRNGPSGGQVLFLIALILCFSLWWYQGGGQEKHRKETKAQESSTEAVLKKKANKDERITSSELGNQEGQKDGTTAENSYTDEDLMKLHPKDGELKRNLGSATFSEQQLWNAYNKVDSNGSAWCSIQRTDGHPYICGLVTDKAIKDSRVAKKSYVTYTLKDSAYQINPHTTLNKLVESKDFIGLDNKEFTKIEDSVVAYLSKNPGEVVYFSIDPIYSKSQLKGAHLMAESFDPQSNEKPGLNYNYYLFN